jgi:hypothetical protein
MRYVLAIIAFVLVLPLLFFVAIALGPVALGILCAVGFGLIVFLAWNALVAVGWLSRSAWRRVHHGEV